MWIDKRDKRISLRSIFQERASALSRLEGSRSFRLMFRMLLASNFDAVRPERNISSLAETNIKSVEKLYFRQNDVLLSFGFGARATHQRKKLKNYFGEVHKK